MILSQNVPTRDSNIVRSECLHELFEATVKAYPEKIALICADQQMTYTQLEDNSNKLARFLRSKGVGKGYRVGLLLERSMNVYITLLAILKTGAAYVPLDPNYPSDRIRYILTDCGIQMLVTTSTVASRHCTFDCDTVYLDQSSSEIENESPQQLSHQETGVSTDLCYIIYTSGSTGRPKGVKIEHRSASNFVRSANTIYGVKTEDRVYQGFSIAFDASVEEVWLAFSTGATLIVGTTEVHSGEVLSSVLTDNKVTVFSCVPTLLSLMDEDVPTIRLLVLGGEQCPQELVTRWSKPGRRILNTYGPTEATVVATCAECVPGKPVTIGLPLPNYQVYLLDSDMQPLPVGVTGEIYIGGICVAQGYVNQSELNREKFVANPFGDRNLSSRLYKTGDLGCFTVTGEIQFQGRIDSQVKLRGFRVELSEIESVLMENLEIQSAVVSVQELVPGIEHLVGYIVPKVATLDVAKISHSLKTRLPSYMIPTFWEVIQELPTLPSGKVDRTKLPRPDNQFQLTKSAGYVAPKTELEQKIAAVWEALFVQKPISINDHFFQDLGGHSLFAARMVSELRNDSAMKEVAVLDLYNNPTIQTLAQKLERDACGSMFDHVSRSASDHRHTKVQSLIETNLHPTLSIPVDLPKWSYPLCGFLQIFGVYLIYLVESLVSLTWVVPYLTSKWVENTGFSATTTIVGVGIISLLGLYPLLLAMTIIVKWVVIGRFKAGSYPLWGSYYFRWWLVRRIQLIVPTEFLVGTPLMNLYCRLMGATIGQNCYIGTQDFQIYDLLTIGDETSIGMAAQLLGYTVEDGMLKIGSIDIGSRCYVGTNTVLSLNSKLSDDAKLDDLSMLPEQTVIPAGQSWGGSPARPMQINLPELPLLKVGSVESKRKTLFYGILHWIALTLLPIVPVTAALPSVLLIDYLYVNSNLFVCLLSAPVAAISFILLFCLEIVLIKWLLLGKVKAKHYQLRSWFYIRKWFVDRLMLLSLEILEPLYGTVYLPIWLRLLGASVGKRAEIATASQLCPDLLFVGDESFIADNVCVGAQQVFQGWVTLLPTKIGKRAFIGNSALLPANSSIGNDCLIGCLSVPPADGAAAKMGTSWMGSPAFFLPQREIDTSYSQQQTFNPPLHLYCQRLFIEYFRVTLPSTLTFMMLSIITACLSNLPDGVTLIQSVLLFPILYFLVGLGAALIVVLLKWVLVGKYKRCTKPLWSTFVWRSELVTGLYEAIAVPLLLDHLLGTPFIAWFIRLLGVKVGTRVFIETSFITEFDLVKIGSNAAINFGSILQTHLFEDRVMKMSYLKVGDRCVVGNMTVILYDTEMKPGSSLNNLSLLMKGETLPPASHWEGIPAIAIIS